MKEKPKISFLIVSYKSAELLDACLGSLESACHDIPYEILIANNDSRPLTVTGSHITVHQNQKNEGFGKAHNALAQHAKAPILCFLNPDTYDFSANFCELRHKLDDDTYGIVAPLVCTEAGGRQQWSSGKNVTPLRIIGNNIFGEKNTTTEDCADVGWVTGAAFMIRKSLFSEIGGFDEKFFLYFEDIDLCRRIRDSGYKIKVFSHYSLKHCSGGSSQGFGQQKKHYFTAQERYLTKYYSAPTVWIMKFLRRMTHPL